MSSHSLTKTPPFPSRVTVKEVRGSSEKSSAGISVAPLVVTSLPALKDSSVEFSSSSSAIEESSSADVSSAFASKSSPAAVSETASGSASSYAATFSIASSFSGAAVSPANAYVCRDPVVSIAASRIATNRFTFFITCVPPCVNMCFILRCFMRFVIYVFHSNHIRIIAIQKTGWLFSDRLYCKMF